MSSQDMRGAGTTLDRDGAELLSPAPPAPRRRWRFSLRELLLVMLAIAAFLGWGGLLYEQLRRFEPSPFFSEQANWQEDIRAALDQIGEDTDVRIRFVSTQSQGPSAVHATQVYRFALPPQGRDAFLEALRQRVVQKLQADRIALRGGGSANSSAGQSRVVSYVTGTRMGTAHLALLPGPEDDVALVISRHEQRAWRGNLSVGSAAGN